MEEREGAGGDERRPGGRGGEREGGQATFSTFKVYILSLIIIILLGLIPHLSDKEIGDSETLNVSPKLTESLEEPDLELKSVFSRQFQLCASASRT